MHSDQTTQTTNTTSLLFHVHQYVNAGLSVLPVLADGTKGPALNTWKYLQSTPPTTDEIDQWFREGSPYGVGIIGGQVSRFLEILDFDVLAIYQEFLQAAEQTGLGPLVDRLRAGCEEASPKGIHLPYYCATIAGNTQLARRPKSAEELHDNPLPPIQGLIETRGEGGYVVAAPSCGTVHKSGKPYHLLQGSWLTVELITPEERADLWDLCRTFDRMPPRPEHAPPPPDPTHATSTRPGDLFAAAVSWAEILEAAGWVWVYRRGDVDHWRRPGKDRGISATTNYAGSDYFYCFSSSTEFDPERGYNKFSVYTRVNHKGNFEQAAEALLRKGYFPRGEQPPDPEPNGADTTSSAQPAPEESSEAGTPPPATPLERPYIRITTDITHVVDEAERALFSLPETLTLFQRTQRLCCVTHEATPPKWLRRPPGAPTITPCSSAQLRERMSQTAAWCKWTARSREWMPALPPEWAVETLHGRQRWTFPVLADVISSPTIRADGEIISAAGYDTETGLFVDTQGIPFPPTPMQPTRDDAVRAREALEAVFHDFPFAAPYGKSAAVAALLSLVSRPAIDGNVPLFLVRSSTRGTGKGLLIDAIATIATGRAAPRWAQSRDAEEDRKALLSLAMEGDALCHIDNLTHALSSGPLDSALTARTIKGRLLGQNKAVEAPMNCVFFASGNNPILGGDIARRIIPIDLESLLENPEARNDFQQPRLLEWMDQERPRLVVDALTILRGYFIAGCPPQQVSAYGSFEQWNDLVRSALVWAGGEDPCAGRADIEAEADPGHDNLASLLHCWVACYHNNAVTLNSVLQDVRLRSAEIIPNEWNELSAALSAFDSRYDGKRLDSKRIGNAMRTVKGRVIDGLRLIQTGRSHQMILWAVQHV